MATLVGTVVKNTQLSALRVLVFTVTLTEHTETVTLTTADHGVRTIYSVMPVLEGGQDEGMLGGLIASFDGLVITIKSQEENGGVADTFSGTTVRVTCLVD